MRTYFNGCSIEPYSTLIQEQNVIPGITNKILNRVVDKVALGYEEARIRFPKPEKCIYTGNPIRPDVVSAQRAESMRKLGYHLKCLW